VDNTLSPVVRARIELDPAPEWGGKDYTGTNGYARVRWDRPFTGRIKVSKEGYITESRAIPARWPLVVKLRREKP
jgi:hypothetical protein